MCAIFTKSNQKQLYRKDVKDKSWYEQNKKRKWIKQILEQV